jgi:hypothetical protein
VIAVLTPKQMKLADTTSAVATCIQGETNHWCAAEGTIARDVVPISDVLSDVMAHVN